MHLLEQIPRPAIIAHRGASAYAPENTLAAFRLALEHGADGIELDARLTADGHVVVSHDPNTGRLTGHSGVVREMTLAELRGLDAGSSYSPSFAGEKIPTLAEVFQEIGARTLINVELKNYATPGDGLTDAVADLVCQYGLQDHILFSSFHPLPLIHIRRRLPGVPAALLTLKGVYGTLMRGLFRAYVSPKVIHPHHSSVSEDYVSTEHRRGRRVNAWTVNDRDEMERLFRIGIDGIITDDPRLARQVLEER